MTKSPQRTRGATGAHDPAIARQILADPRPWGGPESLPARWARLLLARLEFERIEQHGSLFVARRAE